MYNQLKFLYKIYILLFPFQLASFLRPFRDIFSTAAAIQNDFFIFVIGLFVLFMISNGKMRFEEGTICYSSFKFILSLLIVGIITSVVLFFQFDTLYGENTFTASFSQSIYLILTGLIFYFNYSLFQTLSKEEIDNILDILCVLMIVLGVIQVSIMFGFPFIDRFYDMANVFKMYVDSSYIVATYRICMASSEPAGMGFIVCMLLLPYSLGQILANNPHIKRYIIFSVFLVILSFFSFSSAVFVGIGLNCLVFLYLLFSRGKKGFYLLTTFWLVCLLIVLWIKFIADTYVGNQISYLLLDKTTSNEHMSTAYRYTTVINDFFCFIKYPLSGVGNGNQGFLYNEVLNKPFISVKMLNNPQTIIAMDGGLGVIGGGPFTSAYISGYGLIGIIFLINFLKKCHITLKKYGEAIGCYKFMYYIGGTTFLLSAIVSGGLDGNFLAIFVCSLPMMADATRERTENEQ